MWTLGRCFVLNDVWNYFPGNAGALRWYMMIYYVPIWWYMMIYYVPMLQGKTSLEMVGKEWLAWRHWGDEIRIYTYTYHIHIYIYNPTYLLVGRHHFMNVCLVRLRPTNYGWHMLAPMLGRLYPNGHPAESSIDARVAVYMSYYDNEFIMSSYFQYSFTLMLILNMLILFLDIFI